MNGTPVASSGRFRWVVLPSITVLKGTKVFQLFVAPPLTPLRENGLQVAFKQGAGVLEVLFGVGFGGGDAVEGFVEDGDDAVLFGERQINEPSL